MIEMKEMKKSYQRLRGGNLSETRIMIHDIQKLTLWHLERGQLIYDYFSNLFRMYYLHLTRPDTWLPKSRLGSQEQ